MQGLLRKNEKKLTLTFDFTFRYIDDIQQLKNVKSGDCMLIASAKDTTNIARYVSHLDLHIEIDREVKNENLRQKRGY